MWNDPQTLGPIWRELFPVGGMAEYLAGCRFGNWPNDLSDAPLPRPVIFRHQLADAVAYAPLPLARKRELLARLAEGETDGYFAALAGRVQRALTWFYAEKQLPDSTGRLPKEERLLEQARCCLHGDEARGAALGDEIFALRGRGRRAVSRARLAALLRERQQAEKKGLARCRHSQRKERAEWILKLR